MLYLSLLVQGKEVNLFQPAREFIPMIDEVGHVFIFHPCQHMLDMRKFYPKMLEVAIWAGWVTGQTGYILVSFVSNLDG